MFDLGVLLSFMLVAAIGIFVVLPLVFGIDIPGGDNPLGDGSGDGCYNPLGDGNGDGCDNRWV